MNPTDLAMAIKAVGDSLVAVILLFAWLAERKERQSTQDKFDRTLLALAGYKTNPDTSDVVPSDERADKEQRITKKLDHIS